MKKVEKCSQKCAQIKRSVCVFPQQKCMKFNVESPIWLSKQRILCTLNQSLKDVLNYGLFQPAHNGKAGKFLDEQRTLKEYPLPAISPVPYLEVRAVTSYTHAPIISVRSPAILISVTSCCPCIINGFFRIKNAIFPP